MSLIEHAWREASLDWHDELGAALVRELDEDDALTAIQVARKFCVPAPSYQGAVERLRSGFDERDRMLIEEGLRSLEQLTNADHDRVDALLAIFGRQ
jgi:hypothetical protein